LPTGSDRTVHPFESLTTEQLDAVAEIWKRERREFVTFFDGTSMMPAIAPGEQVVVMCGVEPAVGDVILFRFDNQIGVHRVVARTETWLMTWGDANALPDFPITPANVIGAIRDAHRLPRSLYRSLVLRVLAPPSAPAARVTRRVQIVYRFRSLWRQGPLAFAGAILRSVIRRLSSRPGAAKRHRNEGGA
jgi:signal peptidase I